MNTTMNPEITASARHTDWPYPRWIAHRGAGTLAPENTLTAFRLGYQYGYRMFECDAKLSHDGVVFLLHDSTLTRTTNAARAWGEHTSAIASDHAFSALAQLDAGGWHAATFAGEPLPTLASIAHFCIAHQALLNIEIKPTEGQEAATGHAVAALAQQLWQGHTPALLSSFDTAALACAQATAPAVPRALLLEAWRDSMWHEATDLACVALVCHHSLWTAETIARTQALGMRALCYTVNTASKAAQLLDWGIDGIITDRVDVFDPTNDRLAQPTACAHPPMAATAPSQSP